MQVATPSIKTIHSNHPYYHDASSSPACAHNHEDRINERRVCELVEDTLLGTGTVFRAVMVMFGCVSCELTTPCCRGNNEDEGCLPMRTSYEKSKSPKIGDVVNSSPPHKSPTRAMSSTWVVE
jgi:hypothetical protein